MCLVITSMSDLGTALRFSGIFSDGHTDVLPLYGVVLDYAGKACGNCKKVVTVNDPSHTPWKCGYYDHKCQLPAYPCALHNNNCTTQLFIRCKEHAGPIERLCVLQSNPCADMDLCQHPYVKTIRPLAGESDPCSE